jgi:hypothetical protein
MALGLALAFVRTERTAEDVVDEYSFRRLAYAVESHLNPPPEDTRSEIGDAPTHEKYVNQQQSQRKAVPETAKPMTDTGIEAKTKTPIEAVALKPKRVCTLADPFQFDEDDGVYRDEEVAKPQMFGKHVSVKTPTTATKTKLKTESARRPPLDAIKSNQDARQTKKLFKTISGTSPPDIVPKPPLQLTTTTRLKPSQPNPNPNPKPKSNPSIRDTKDDHSRPSRRRRAADADRPWWESKHFSWERRHPSTTA